MDFSFNEEQEAVAQSAAAVFSGMAGTERVAAIERTEQRFDEELWQKLADANLLGIAVPVEYGGSGLGLCEVCLVLEAQGAAVAPVPLWATSVLGAMPIARFGTDEQRRRLLPGVVSGETRLTAAITEVAALGGDRAAGVTPWTVTARRRNGAWSLEGVARAVPQAHLAERVMVPAAVGDELGVFLVNPRGAGVKLESAITTDRQLHPHVWLDGAPVEERDVLAPAPEGAGVLAWTLDRARTGLCAIALGVCEEAVTRTSAYLNERQQFGRPLASFQAAKLRVADAYIDTEAIRVTTWQAAWRLDTGRPATEEVASAKWWASEAGQRVVHATQHLHGGIGADVEYPIHRYFLWGKQIELMLGGPSSELARLGSLIATRLAAAGTAAGDRATQ